MGKIVSLLDLPDLGKEWKANKVKIVLVTGVFDLLHREHKKFLRKAKENGGILFVGVEKNERVKKLKGKNRPVWGLKKRMKDLTSLPVVDYVFALPRKFDKKIDHEKLIFLLKPDLLAVSSNTPFLEEKKFLLQKFGGKVKVVLKFNPDISTTKILQQKRPTP